MPEQTAADMDGGWKQIIDDYVEEFFHFFFPQVHAAIDFHQECQSLDKELAKIMVGAKVGDREADKLLRVHWHDGGDDLVLVHVEVQAQNEADFAQRMCVYDGLYIDVARRVVPAVRRRIGEDGGGTKHALYHQHRAERTTARD